MATVSQGRDAGTPATQESREIERTGCRQRLGFALSTAFGLLVATQAFGQDAQCKNQSANATQSWVRWECVLEVNGENGADFSGRKGYADTRLKVTFSAPGMYTRTGYAFWDGGTGIGADKARFVTRFAFPASSVPKTWSWVTTCETPSTCGDSVSHPDLISSGSVVVSPYASTNKLYQRGFLGKWNMGWYVPGVGLRTWHTLGFVGSGNLDFAWIGDSAWAAPMKATAAHWTTYLANRREGPSEWNKGVSVVQIGLAPAWAGSQDAQLPPVGPQAPFSTLASCQATCPLPRASCASSCTLQPIVPTNCSLPNPLFWRELDRKIQEANDAGIYILITGLMEPRSDHPGETGPEDFPMPSQAKTFARWMASRVAGSFVILSPGFDAPAINKWEDLDGDCTDAADPNEYVRLQEAVGPEIDAVVGRHLITNHFSNQGTPSTMDDLQNLSWLDFQMFQSGFGAGTNQQDKLTSLTQRAREVAWQMSGTSSGTLPPVTNPRKAAVNSEAIYNQGGVPNSNYSAYRARQAGYLSWLSGAFGYTFGVGGVWDWGLCGLPQPNACLTYQLGSAYDSFADDLQRQDSKQILTMGNVLRAYQTVSFSDYLDTYDQSRIRFQPAAQEQKMVMARGSDLLVAYLPWNQTIEIQTQGLSFNFSSAYLRDPKTGITTTVAEGGTPNYSCFSCLQGQQCCRWTNKAFLLDAALSDRILYMSRTTTAPGAWSGQSDIDLQVLSGKLAPSPERGGQERPTGILGLLLNNKGEPQGELFEISAVAGVLPIRPRAARSGTGDFLVVWQADFDGDGWQEIRGRWVNKGGGLVGDEFRVSPEDGLEQASPAVGVNSAGDAVVVWVAAGPVLDTPEVWGQAVIDSGNLVGGPVELLSGAGYEYHTPRIASDAAGIFTLAWVQRDPVTEEAAIRSQRLNGLLSPLGPSQQVNTSSAQSFWLGPVVVDAAGVVKIEWESREFERGLGWYERAFDNQGKAAGGETLVSPPYSE